MRKGRLGFILLLLFVFAVTFSASMHEVLAGGEAICDCNFWCECAEVWHGGEWYPEPYPGRCANSETNVWCICPCD